MHELPDLRNIPPKPLPVVLEVSLRGSWAEVSGASVTVPASRGPVQLPTLLTEALEIGLPRHRSVATLWTDKQAFRSRQHESEVNAQNAIWAAYDLISHFAPSALSLFAPAPWLRSLKLWLQLPVLLGSHGF